MSVFEAIKNRRSIRKYDKRPIEKEKLEKLWEGLRLAPSANNIQPWHYIVVDDPDLIEEVAVSCHNQKFIVTAPLVLVGCSDESIAYKLMGSYLNTFAIDLAIGFDHLTLLAYELGLGTCWIGSFEEVEVKRLLNIPDNYRVVALTPIGYPQQNPAPSKRKDWPEISSHNKFGE